MVFCTISFYCQPLLREHSDYSVTIDSVNNLGKTLDDATKGERPESPRRHILISPTKKAPSPTRKSPSRKQPFVIG